METSCQSFGNSLASGVRGDTRARNTDLGVYNKEILEALRVECVFPRSGDLEKRVKDRTWRKSLFHTGMQKYPLRRKTEKEWSLWKGGRCPGS